MKIIVIGTSNSIIGRSGFIKSLSLNHEVTNLSIERSPIYMHISNILRNSDLIESSDIILIDHLSNPAFLQADDYFNHLENFYNILSAINCHVAILCFPSLIQNETLNKYREFSENLAKQRKITFINLKKEIFSNEMFIDPMHVNTRASYIIGEWLSICFSSIEHDEKPSNGSFQGYKFIEPQEKTEKFKNSLLERNYTVVDDQKITFLESKVEILSIEYLNRQKDSIINFKINNEEYSLFEPDVGVLCEAFINPIKIDESIGIEKGNNFGKFVLINRIKKSESSTHNDLLFIGMLLHGGFNFKASQNRTEINLDYKNLTSRLNDHFSFYINQSNDEINVLRDSALIIENVDLEKAYKLMQMAQKGRPKGAFINKKVDDFKAALQKSKLNT